MSFGISPYDFVKQVYYKQEGVVLDFWPTDDKYKEVLLEANLVLQELQNSEDWSWLRQRIELGSLKPPFNGSDEIPEFELPEWVYKVSTYYHDGLRLCKKSPYTNEVSNHNPIHVPYTSVGNNMILDRKAFNSYGNIDVEDMTLKAILIGNIVTFNRVLFPHEYIDRVAVCDVQRRIEQFHICDSTCKGVDDTQAISYELVDGKYKNPCSKIENKILTDVPDPNYVIIQTAAQHAEFSPPAQGRIQNLVDKSQKILSAMRQNNASYTDSDTLEWDSFNTIEVI